MEKGALSAMCRSRITWLHKRWDGQELSGPTLNRGLGWMTSRGPFQTKLSSEFLNWCFWRALSLFTLAPCTGCRQYDTQGLAASNRLCCSNMVCNGPRVSPARHMDLSTRTPAFLILTGVAQCPLFRSPVHFQHLEQMEQCNLKVDLNCDYSLVRANLFGELEKLNSDMNVKLTKWRGF